MVAKTNKIELYIFVNINNLLVVIYNGTSYTIFIYIFRQDKKQKIERDRGSKVR